MIKLSVVIPTYNEEEFLGVCLGSVKRQLGNFAEIIVVDDQSTDKTVQIAKKYTRKVFPRKHADRSVQRNFGVGKASGKYVLLLDADMVLPKGILEDILAVVEKDPDIKAVTIPEKTVVTRFVSKIRNFEREMYEGDPTIEVPRLFDKKVFLEFGGYDPKLTGPEDYDLPYRISKKYKIGRSKKYLYHNEGDYNLWVLLKKKFNYAKGGAAYAKKHPELIKTQGNLIFRKAYLKNWNKFVIHPVLGVSFIVVRILETVAAILGFISVVGVAGFIKAIPNLFKK